MPTTATDLISVAEIQQYLTLLYPEAPDDAWLVVSWANATTPFTSEWFHCSKRSAAIQCILDHAVTHNTYVGLGLRHPQCAASHGRGASADICAIGGLWIEFDHNGGAHSASNLPTPTELMAFIHELPVTFSLLVDSGGGFHAYLLFKELWMLDTPDEHARAAQLLRRFQYTIQQRSRDRGWKIDNTADLARVLRPAGTVNHKDAAMKPVMVLDEQPQRYNPSDIADALWLASIDIPHTGPTSPTSWGPARLAPIETGCAWMTHCRDDAAQLPEPEWYAMLSILTRCEDGEALAHTWSAPHPEYSAAETDAKSQQSLKHGPRTCTYIRYSLNGESYCAQCPSWGHIKSPITLGKPPGTVLFPPGGDPFGAPPGWGVLLNGNASSTQGAAPLSQTGPPQWRNHLLKKKGGGLVQDVRNFSLLLEHAEYWRGQLWWDDVRSRPMFGSHDIDEDVLVGIGRWMGTEEEISVTNLRMLERCVLSQCRKNKHDLIRYWLEHLPAWDQKPRLTSWLKEIAGVEDTVYGEEVARLLLTSMVARGMDPGCICRYVVILEGAEEFRKSTLVEALASPEWYVILSIGLDSKDSHMMLQGAWVAEMAELDSLSKTEETRLKAFITMRSDSYVPKYSNFRENHARRTIFVGTTNEDHYLKGQTGNTRFLPIRITKPVDIETFLEIREQLFAEALLAYRSNPRWWAMSAEGAESAKEQRDRRRLPNVYETPLREWLDVLRHSFEHPLHDADGRIVEFVRNETSWQEIAQYYLRLDTPEKWKDKGLQMQIAQALKSLGWHRAQLWRNGGKIDGWEYVEGA